MEFHEKLQQLRKQKELTQEQLAQQLFVSRTAVSKWESGRGYPNLESLKDISRLFSISIDELLSNNELLELAETETRANVSKLSGLVFGALDLISGALLFLPLLGQQDGAHIRAVTLLEHTGLTPPLRALYAASLVLLSLFGVCHGVWELREREKHQNLRKPCSLALHAAVIVLFTVSRQPYMTTALFLLFLVKIVLILQENRIS